MVSGLYYLFRICLFHPFGDYLKLQKFLNMFWAEWIKYVYTHG